MLLSKEQWCKYSAYRRPDGTPCLLNEFRITKGAKCCLHGATALDPKTEDDVNDTLKAAIRKLGWESRATASKWGLIAGFNDHPDTTWEDVQCVIAELNS